MKLALAILCFIAGLICFALTGCALQKSEVRSQRSELAAVESCFPAFDSHNTPESYRSEFGVRSSEFGVIFHATGQSVPISDLPSPVSRTATNLNIGWTANTASEVFGYRIYYGLTPGDYTGTAFVYNTAAVNLGALECGRTYYLAARSVASDCTEGDFSDELAIQLPLILDLHFNSDLRTPNSNLQRSEDLATWLPCPSEPIPTGWRVNEGMTGTTAFYRTAVNP